MPRYEVYAAMGGSRKGTCVYSFDAGDDVAAEKFVCDRLTDVPVQLWHRSRRVAEFGGGGAG
jgi:hypothetical protein